jgi:hypothetical protein
LHKKREITYLNQKIKYKEKETKVVAEEEGAENNNNKKSTAWI